MDDKDVLYLGWDSGHMGVLFTSKFLKLNLGIQCENPGRKIKRKDSRFSVG